MPHTDSISAKINSYEINNIFLNIFQTISEYIINIKIQRENMLHI